jgi:hypothetical protein
VACLVSTENYHTSSHYSYADLSHNLGLKKGTFVQLAFSNGSSSLKAGNDVELASVKRTGSDFYCYVRDQSRAQSRTRRMRWKDRSATPPAKNKSITTCRRHELGRRQLDPGPEYVRLQAFHDLNRTGSIGSLANNANVWLPLQ